MNFSSWQAFFSMGGYALYVWLSYGLMLLVLGTLVITPILRHRQLQRDIARRQRRAQRNENAS